MLRCCLGVLFVLGTTSAAIASPKPTDQAEKSVEGKDKVICKRFVETGSLVKSTRICKTRREWEQQRDDLRAAARSGSGSCPNADTIC